MIPLLLLYVMLQDLLKPPSHVAFWNSGIREDFANRLSLFLLTIAIFFPCKCPPL
jgi:hypothetical protein